MTHDEWKAKLAELQQRIGYQFLDKTFLHAALTHASINVQSPNMVNYERLEFLGDRVLGLVVAAVLYHNFSHESEGELARRHAGLVCGVSLYRVATTLHLGDYIYMTNAEEATGGRSNATILEDSLEALIGAIYLDGGMRAAEDFIRQQWILLFASVKEAPKDAKSSLQEWAQKHGFPLPTYHETGRKGTDHAPIFTIEVVIAGSNYRATAIGKSKKEAEQGAAAALLGALEQ